MFAKTLVPGRVCRLDGEFVILMQKQGSDWWVRWEDDNTNTQVLVHVTRLY